MTTPVCPACRATITLDTFSCPRCGLSVRPTCASCGEPLAHGMDACWFCREPITEPDPGPAMSAARAAAAFGSTPVPPPPPPRAVDRPVEPVTEPIAAPVRTPPPPAVWSAPAPIVVRRPSRRVRWGRVVVLGLVGAVVLTVGALAYESSWTGDLTPRADDVALTRATYEDVGAAVAYPSDWEVQRTRRRVTFVSGEVAKDKSTRGFRVAADDLKYSRVDEEIEDLSDRFVDYAALDTFEDSVSGEPATVHVFVGDGLRFELWWVERGKGTLRIDLWSRLADERVTDLNERLIDEIEVL